MDEMRELVQEAYLLDDAVVDRIEFQYSTKIGKKGNEKIVRINEGAQKLEGVIRVNDDPDIPGRPLTLQDLDMKVRYRDGDTIEVDCNCDSAYMLTAMDRVGQSIRASYHWVPPSEKCYLVMDNAGGAWNERCN